MSGWTHGRDCVRLLQHQRGALATGSFDHDSRLWDVRSGQRVYGCCQVIEEKLAVQCSTMQVGLAAGQCWGGKRHGGGHQIQVLDRASLITV